LTPAHTAHAINSCARPCDQAAVLTADRTTAVQEVRSSYPSACRNEPKCLR